MKRIIVESVIAAMLISAGTGLQPVQTPEAWPPAVIGQEQPSESKDVPLTMHLSKPTELEAEPWWTDDDVRILARLIYSEARGEGRQGMLLVAQCVLDRLEAGRWGNSIRKVALSKQFARQGALTDECYDIALEALKGERALPAYKVYYFKVTKSKRGWYADYIEHVGGHAVYGERREDRTVAALVP